MSVVSSTAAVTKVTKTQTINDVLQNNSATAPCGGTSGPSGSGSEVAAADLVLRRDGPQMDVPATSTPAAAAADTEFKLLAIDSSSEAPTVAGEPVTVLCCAVAGNLTQSLSHRFSDQVLFITVASCLGSPLLTCTVWYRSK